MRILSGIQPSGALHIGNYFGMMRPALELQEQGEAFYFIADLHSMTSLFDAAERRRNSLDVALDFLAFPGWLVEPFLPRDVEPGQAAALVTLGSTLVRYVALYTLFDAMGIIYIGALKGAGDSRFVMLNMAVVAGLFLVLPTYLGVNHLGWDIHRVWFCIILYLVVLGLTNWRRYRRGAWRRMRVVETAAPARG